MPIARRHLIVACVLVCGCLLAAPAFASAPKQLYNKTIQINWTATVNRIGDGGQLRSLPTAVSHTIYVSSAGRVFQRGSRAGKRGKKQTENAPGATHNKGGEANSVRFEGNRLVGITAFAQGARRFVATFDPGSSSCTVSVTFGREGGGMRRKGIDGKTHTIESMSASGESCSIREGNPFGD